jgi:hypothetical protein
MGVPRQLSVLMLLPALLGILGAIWFAIDLIVHRPVEKVVVGEWLQLWPSRAKFMVHEVSQIEFVTTVVQDYAEPGVLDNNRETQITVQTRSGYRSIQLSFDPADASRLTEWARDNGIPIVGAERER